MNTKPLSAGNLPEYANPLGRWDVNLIPYIPSSPNESRSWSFVNSCGVLVYPEIVYDYQGKHLQITLQVACYEGYYDDGVSLTAIHPAYSGVGWLPSVGSALRNGRKTERDVILSLIEYTREFFTQQKGTDNPDYRKFEEWAKEYECPSPVQLTLF